jgi:hypothetical protein
MLLPLCLMMFQGRHVNIRCLICLFFKIKYQHHTCCDNGRTSFKALMLMFEVNTLYNFVVNTNITKALDHEAGNSILLET